MGCTTTTLKFTVVVLNILCVVFGALMLSASAYCLNGFSGSDLIQVPCSVGLALGSLLFLTIIPGCCGPLRESVRTIWIYAICIWLLMCAQIAVNLVLPLNFDTLAEETISHAWALDLTHNGTMAAYETKLSCCGKYGPQDYTLSGLSIPSSCYTDTSNSESLVTTGCIQKLQEVFENSERIEVISDWTLVGIEFITGLLSGMLAINLKNIERRRLFH